MKLLQQAMLRARSLASPRAVGLLVLAVFGTLIPTLAFGAEGDNVKLAFSSSDRNLLYLSLLLGFVALGFGAYFRSKVMSQSPGSEKMQSVGLAIREGALAYLSQQVRTMLYFVVALAAGLAALNWNKDASHITAIEIAACFIG